jgi:pimeloyl-ACP methyl ester carboxylesterase
MKKRTAVLSAGIAVGALAIGTAGAVGGIVRKRRRSHLHGAAGPVGDVPPEVLGPIPSFDDTALAVRAAGDPAAPVLLLAHGFSLDMSIWSMLWPDLARSYRVVTMDFRSHGQSAPAAHGDLSLRAMGRDVAAVLQAVAGDGPAFVAGHSMGGMAILAMAEQRPELFVRDVGGVALIGTASGDLVRGAMGSVAEVLRPRLGSFSGAARRVDRLRKAVLSSPADLSGVVARVTQFAPDAPDEIVDHVVSLAQRTASEVWTDGLPQLMEMDLRHAVPRVRVPALVVVGDQDRVTPPAASVELAGALPDGHLLIVEGAGHMAMLERPEDLIRGLGDFASAALAREEGPQARRTGTRRRRTA